MSTADARHAGRCLCGAVRYAADCEPKWIANCHCESCRRAVGAPLTTYAGFPAERFAWTAGAPVRFASSPGVVRSFCGRCGTSLTFEGERWAGEVHVLVATLGHPEDFPPHGESFVEEKLPWLQLGEDGGP
jgi:hypothetical protein